MAGLERLRSLGLAEERLTTATELMRGWIWETDVEHRFTYFSDSVLWFAGRPPAWHYGKTREELGNIALDPVEREAFTRQLSARAPFGPLEFKRDQDGRVVWMRTIGTPLFDREGTFHGYRGIALDISAEFDARRLQQETQAELDALLNILSATIECLPFAIGIFNNNRRLAAANGAYYALFDLSRQRFPAGTSYDDIFAYLGERGEFRGGDVGDLVARQIAIMDSGEPHTYERTRPDGRIISVTGTPLPCGGLLRTYVDVTDRTELKWKLAAVQRIAEDLRRLVGPRDPGDKSR